ncbi:hypothetical protein [Brachyspira sp.]|uniref:hypothetical protein n=1 Tax=Brachyspira sp. TaxID=1977261 RepID=UPI00345BF06C
MNKKLLTIFLSLFLVGILSVSCSNKDKTAPKGIEQYNGTYDQHLLQFQEIIYG